MSKVFPFCSVVERFCGGHKLGNVHIMVVTYACMDGGSNRCYILSGTFQSPWHIRYVIEPDMPMTYYGEP